MYDSDDTLIALVLLEEQPLAGKTRFDFENTPETSSIWWDFFRFEKNDLILLTSVLELDPQLEVRGNYRISRIEALCIFLHGLAYPNCLCELEVFFGRSKTCISIVFNAILDHIFNYFGHLLVGISFVSQKKNL